MFRLACACAGATMKSSTDAAAASNTSCAPFSRTDVCLSSSRLVDSDDLSLPQTSSMILSAAFSAAAAGKYTLIVTQADRARQHAIRFNEAWRSIVGSFATSGECYCSLHCRATGFRGGDQLLHQPRPIHAPRAADHVDARQALPLDQVITAVRSGRDAVHCAHVVLQPAGQAETLVNEVVEKSLEAARQRRGDAGSAAADAADVLDRALADAMFRAVARRRVEPRIEGDRRPVEQPQPVDATGQAAGDAAERERTRHQLQVEILERDVGGKTRPL